MKRASIVFDTTGGARMIYDDRLAPVARALGRVETRRASEVEPYGDGWAADMARVGGPVLLAGEGEPYATREAALAAERAWLETNRIPVPR